MSKNKLASMVLVVLMALHTSGCVPLLVGAAGAAGAAGTATWLSRKLVKEVDGSFDETIDAAESAIQSLGFIVLKKMRKAEAAQIISRYTEGERIWIDIHRVSSSLSRVEVRVGIMGDEEASHRLMDKIEQYL